VLIPAAEVERMRQQIRGSALKVMPQAGHYAVFERAEEAAGLARQFLDGCA
jgi:pimeloyl-ACP methyl ester carboxylesterase